MIDIIQHSGPKAFVLLFFGIIGLLLAGAAAVILGISITSPAKVGKKLVTLNLPVLLLFIMITGGLGIAFYFYDMHIVSEALQMAAPQHKDVLQAKGEEMARYSLWISLACIALPSLMLVLTGVRTVTMQEPTDEN